MSARSNTQAGWKQARPGLTRLGNVAACTLLVGFAALVGCPKSRAPETSGASSERIGVYDSRAIAVAYVGSDILNAHLRGVRAEYEAAKSRGDTARVAAIDAEMNAQQREMHRQGFGTAPVDDLLEHIKGELPRIRAEADVTALVSKWDEAALAAYPNATRVDVTMPLVDAFHPNQRQRKSAEEVQRHEPMPKEELEEHLDDPNF